MIKASPKELIAARGSAVLSVIGRGRRSVPRMAPAKIPAADVARVKTDTKEALFAFAVDWRESARGTMSVLR